MKTVRLFRCKKEFLDYQDVKIRFGEVMAVSEISQLPWTPIITAGGFVYSEYWEEIFPVCGPERTEFLLRNINEDGEDIL